MENPLEMEVLMGKTSINGLCSMAMLNNQRVSCAVPQPGSDQHPPRATLSWPWPPRWWDCRRKDAVRCAAHILRPCDGKKDEWKTMENSNVWTMLWDFVAQCSFEGCPPEPSKQVELKKSDHEIIALNKSNRVEKTTSRSCCSQPYRRHSLYLRSSYPCGHPAEPWKMAMSILCLNHG